MNGFPPPTLKELKELVAIMRSLNLGSEPPPASDARCSSGRLSYRLTPDMMGDIVRRYKAGEATTTLSENYGVSRSSIASLLRKEGVVLRGQAMTKESTSQAIALYNQRFRFDRWLRKLVTRMVLSVWRYIGTVSK